MTAALFAVLSMNLSGPMADRVGARTPTLVGGVVMLVASLVMGAAPSYVVLVLGAALFGVGNGAMDVCMNALGVSVETARRRPVMSRLHAFFSIGNFVGALSWSWSGGCSPRPGHPVVAVDGGPAARGAARRVRPVTPQSPPRAATPGGGGGRIPSAAWLLAAMAVCFGLTEGTGVDWSSLHVSEVGHVSPTSGAWGLACVSGFMVVIRLMGDAVVERLGRALVVRVGALVALLGYLLTAFAGDLVPILVGWCLVGLGVGLIAPQIYGLAGHVGGGRGLAVVVSFGYAAFLVGPAIIGFVASQSSLQRAMLVPVVTAVGLVVLSTRMPADPTDDRVAPRPCLACSTRS